jgi:hypothetical protein
MFTLLPGGELGALLFLMLSIALVFMFPAITTWLPNAIGW